MIELDGVTKKYGTLTALRDVSFRVEKNETVGLLGRNGAGKTTLLNLMTGYFPPTAGQIRIGGKSMREDAAACKRMIGYLPEKPPLYDEMTVESYLRFVCELREVKRQGIRAHTDEILSLCGLQEVRSRVMGHLSKGYRQRAGIAQALCGAPEILILDEPTVGLDPKQTVEIRDLIRRRGRCPLPAAVHRGRSGESSPEAPSPGRVFRRGGPAVRGNGDHRGADKAGTGRGQRSGTGQGFPHPG